MIILLLPIQHGELSLVAKGATEVRWAASYLPDQEDPGGRHRPENTAGTKYQSVQIEWN